MVKAKRVIWPQKARKQLREAYEYIKLDSVQNAEKVRKEILGNIKQIMTAVIGLTNSIDIADPTILEKKK